MISIPLPYYAQLNLIGAIANHQGRALCKIDFILKCGNRQIHGIQILLDVALFNPLKKKLVFV